MTDPSKKSGYSFVTVVAWIFIVIGGFSTFASVIQNVVVNTVMPVDQMLADFERLDAAFNGPFSPLFLLRHIRLLVALFLLASLGTLVAAIALLKRKNWGRLLFLGVLGLGILWNLASLGVQYAFVTGFTLPPQAPPEAAAQFKSAAWGVLGFAAFIALGISAVLAWIAKRLCAPEVLREFGQMG